MFVVSFFSQIIFYKSIEFINSFSNVDSFSLINTLLLFLLYYYNFKSRLNYETGFSFFSNDECYFFISIFLSIFYFFLMFFLLVIVFDYENASQKNEIILLLTYVFSTIIIAYIFSLLSIVLSKFFLIYKSKKS